MTPRPSCSRLDAVGKLYAAIVSDQAHFVRDAWVALDEHTRGKTPEQERPHVERVVWALHVHEQLGLRRSDELA